MTSVYEPSRALSAKIGRRLTQWRAAKPVKIAPNQPILSITFDDFPASVVRHGLPVLAAAEVRATVYACAGLQDADSLYGPMFSKSDLAAVQNEGHEIGCHSHSHLDCAKAAPGMVLNDCARNAESLGALGLKAPPRNMAYPYGETSFALKQALASRFATARGILPGLNIGWSDRLQLRAVSLYGEHAHRLVSPWLARAAARQAWLILFTHDVAPKPSRFGTTPKALADTIQNAKDLGFAVLPVGEAADHVLKAAP